jgi:hypothetical protein
MVTNGILALDLSSFRMYSKFKEWLRLINYESKPNEGKKVTESYKRYYKGKNKL